jgi:NTE family protein
LAGIGFADEEHMLGLVLTAGGARGAYQAGVLKRIAQIPALRERSQPFEIISGASAGAINGTILAAQPGGFAGAAAQVADVWSELSVDQVFRTDLLALATGGASLLRDFTLGSLLGWTQTYGLLDTSPLAKLVCGALPPNGVRGAIERGDLYAVAITATSYHSGRSYIFVQGRQGHAMWSGSRRVVVPVTLTPQHVLASGAIPLVFPPVRIDSDAGELWFGDGGLRLVAPLSPAIRLGASRLLAIGVRSTNAADALAKREAWSSTPEGEGGPRPPCPPLAQICGVFLNAIFLDHLDTDVDHLQRMNELVAAHGSMNGASPHAAMRQITPLVISPSEDLALVAQRFAHRMPRLLRFVMDGLGTPDAQSADLMSYLLFDSAYTGTLVDIGYRDAHARIGEIEELIRGFRSPVEESAEVDGQVLRPAEEPHLLPVH